MNIQINKNDLLKAVQLVSVAVNSKPVTPLLANILFEVEGNDVRLSGTNYEIGISTGVIALKNKKASFTTAIPAKLFMDLLSTFYEETVELNFDATKEYLKVKSGTAEHNIKCMNATEYPTIDIKAGKEIMTPGYLLKEAIERVAFAASPTTTSVLNGVLLENNNCNLVLFATDGFHLSFEQIELPKGDKTKEFNSIISSNVLELLAKIIPDDTDIYISSNDVQVKFQLGPTVFVSQKISGKLPDYNQFKASISKPTSNIVLPTLQTLRACKQLELFSENKIKFEFNEMVVELTATAQERGNGNVTILSNGSTGKPIVAGINVFLLRKFLEICKTDEVLMDFSLPTNPILLQMKDFETYYHIIMPMNL